jgi:hypothetical protein
LRILNDIVAVGVRVEELVPDEAGGGELCSLEVPGTGGSRPQRREARLSDSRVVLPGRNHDPDVNENVFALYLGNSQHG